MIFDEIRSVFLVKVFPTKKAFKSLDNPLLLLPGVISQELEVEIPLDEHSRSLPSHRLHPSQSIPNQSPTLPAQNDLERLIGEVPTKVQYKPQQSYQLSK